MPNQIEKEFIAQNINSDINSIILNKNKFDKRIDISLAINQIYARSKFHLKFPSLCSNLDLEFPSHLPLEQASSEACSRFKATLVEYSFSADLNGGMGADSIEFAKRSKRHHYNELNSELAELFDINARILNLDNIQIHCGDALELIDKLPDNTDLIYFDPSRRDENGTKTYFITETKPNPIDIIKKIKERFPSDNYPKILIKASPLLDISKAIYDLEHVTKIWVVSVDNEVKETLFLLNLKNSDELAYYCANIKNDSTDIIEFKRSNKVRELISEPLEYLYEPNRAILKLGFWGELCEKYNVFQIGENTRLFTSNELIENFPGRKFKILNITKLDKKILSNLYPDKKANIAARNFPLAVDQIKKKIGFRDGGDIYFFAATIKNNIKAIIICDKA